MKRNVGAKRMIISPAGQAAQTTVAQGTASKMSRSRERAVSLLSPLALLLLWEALARLGVVDVRFFPPPSGIVETFWRLLISGELVTNVAVSISRSLVGLVLGAVPGLILGFSMGLSVMVRAAVWPMIGALYPVPKIAIFPLVLLLFGLGETSKWVIIALGVFFPVLINSMAGVMGIEPIYHDVSHNYGASRLNRYLTVALPGALPMVVAGLRLAWGMALLLMVTAEMMSAKSGIGFLIWQSWQVFAVEAMYVGILTISIVGYVSFLILDALARWMVPWRPSSVS